MSFSDLWITRSLGAPECFDESVDAVDPTIHLEEMANRIWPDAVSAIDALVRRNEREREWSTAAESALAGDDRKTAPYQTSHAIQMLLNAGIDNLNGVRHLIFGRPEDGPTQPVLHMAAHFLLARGALENFATALWILGPNSRPERVERTLRWHVKNASDQHQAMTQSGFETSDGDRLALKFERLERIQLDATGQVPTNFRQGYWATSVVKYADTVDPDPAGLTTLFIWQLSSAFAHGRPWASLSFLSRELQETDDANVLHARMTSDMFRALLAPKRALEICETLLRRHQALNTPLTLKR